MHLATPDEVHLADAAAKALHRRFTELMDCRVGIGQWDKPGPAENACLQAESDVLGWLYLAKQGVAVREPLDRTLRRTAIKLEAWGWPVPAELAAPSAEGVERG